MRDGNDVRGRLDLKRASVSVTKGTLVHTFTMYAKWSNDLLANTGKDLFVCLYLWRGGVPRSPGKQEYQVCAAQRDGVLTADLYFLPARTSFGPVAVSRPDPRSIRFVIKRSDVTFFDDYAWLAATKDGQFDIAPNRRPRRQRL